MDDRIAQLLEKQAIVETINRLFLATDRRDWPGVRACFADEVLFDMTSSTGGEPERLSPEEIASGWEKGLAGLKAVHHQAGNYLVDVRGAEADAFCYGIASHYLPGDPGGETRVFVGSYELKLRKESGRWRIDSFRFNQKYVEGNVRLGAKRDEV